MHLNIWFSGHKINLWAFASNGYSISVSMVISMVILIGRQIPQRITTQKIYLTTEILCSEKKLSPTFNLE